MIGGRVLASSIRRSGLSWRSITGQKPWANSVSSSARSLSSLKAASLGSAAFPQKPSPFTDMNLINKRFFQNGNSNKSSDSSTSTLSSKIFAACGALLGIASGATYYAMWGNRDSIFGKYYLASCAEKGSCGCGNEKDQCIEKKCEESACLRALECEEQIISRANAELEKAIKDTKGRAVEYTEAAMKAYCKAIAAMCDFLNNGYSLLDDDELYPPEYEEAWCCLYKLAKRRCERVKDAMMKGQCAWELLCRLREIIENGKACKYTTCHPLLVTAEEALKCAEKELLDKKADFDCTRSDHDMAEQYKSVIESFRCDLKPEVDRQIAEMGCDIKFPEQEVAMQILEAYTRVIRAQKEMAHDLVCKGRVPKRLAQTCC